jgi:ABC-type sugar transport system ATPase subunit
MLSAQNVNKQFGGRVILRDCSITVNTGQCLLIRGPSGCGKSTLIRILALLEQADSGRVIHGDLSWDASKLNKTSVYPFLTLVFQQLFLWPNLTMRQNISIALTHQKDGALPKLAMEMLERFTIATVLDRRPDECSLGERQRLAIARALLSDARFLLLDEPSSALDRANQVQLVEELKSALANDRGVLLITHDERGYDGVVSESFELENAQLRKL